MYTLTLTESERNAIDWMHGRSAIGDIKRVLISCLHEDISWHDDGNIIFEIPEYLAWEMQAIREENGRETWTCLSDGLVSKFEEFLGKIV